MAGASRKSLAGGSRRSMQMQRQNSISPATGCIAVFPFPIMKKDKLDMPATSPLEKLYRFMWRRKDSQLISRPLCKRRYSESLLRDKASSLKQKMRSGGSHGRYHQEVGSGEHLRYLTYYSIAQPCGEETHEG